MTASSAERLKPLVGLSLMVEQDFLAASYPLFESGEVDVIEWSMELGWTPVPIPTWSQELLAFFSNQNRLLGHGVTYSPCSAEPGIWQEQWLGRMKELLHELKFQHMSEHFGVCAGGVYSETAPMPVPLTDAVVEATIASLRKLKELVHVPVGLENLALAFGRRDVLDQGEFLNRVLSPLDGFIVLDLHNLFCQMYNFKLTASEILDLYPLPLVKEIHIAGGSWSRSQFTSTTVRRDTHDGDVPDEVFEFLPLALSRCSAVQYIIFERLGDTITGDGDQQRFQIDYMRVKKIVQDWISVNEL